MVRRRVRDAIHGNGGECRHETLPITSGSRPVTHHKEPWGTTHSCDAPPTSEMRAKSLSKWRTTRRACFAARGDDEVGDRHPVLATAAQCVLELDCGGHHLGCYGCSVEASPLLEDLFVVGQTAGAVKHFQVDDRARRHEAVL